MIKQRKCVCVWGREKRREIERDKEEVESGERRTDGLMWTRRESKRDRNIYIYRETEREMKKKDRETKGIKQTNRSSSNLKQH